MNSMLTELKLHINEVDMTKFDQEPVNLPATKVEHFKSVILLNGANKSSDFKNNFANVFYILSITNF